MRQPCLFQGALHVSQAATARRIPSLAVAAASAHLGRYARGDGALAARACHLLGDVPVAEAEAVAEGTRPLRLLEAHPHTRVRLVGHAAVLGEVEGAAGGSAAEVAPRGTQRLKGLGVQDAA